MKESEGEAKQEREGESRRETTAEGDLGSDREVLQVELVEIEGGGLSGRDRARLQGVRELLAAEGSSEYVTVQREVAERLGISVRSVQRMMKAWREEGLSGVQRERRSDRGEKRISEKWQRYIQRVYREGNRGSSEMSPLQVALRVEAEAKAKGETDYPSQMSVYRVLKPLIDRQQRVKRSIGWRSGKIVVRTREGLEIAVSHSNQVWQVDHTKVDVLVVDSAGELLGRPWLTIVVDMHSRCMMGMHLGFDAPSAEVVCLALRHAILPKNYPSRYGLAENWGTYGVPQYLYTDGGKDFRSEHIEQVTLTLGIVPCLRRKPSDGGIVERVFGTLNSTFFSSLPGYTGSNVVERSPHAEAEASLTIQDLEQLLVRYIVDHYNQKEDEREGDRRIGLWESGLSAQLNLLGERELDICLMRRDRRVVYRNGYLQFANLT